MAAPFALQYIAPVQTRWPVLDLRTDPWDDGCWRSFDTDDRYTALWSTWDAYRSGEATEQDFEQTARSHGLADPVLEDRNTPPWDLPCPTLATLARIAADPWPAVGGDAPDLVLGPASILADRPTLLAAVAGCAFAITEDRPQTSFHMWCRGKPVPRRTLRAAVRAVGLAPWALWERESDGSLRDRTGLASVYQPDGPVEFIGDVGRPRFLAARVLRTDRGWVAHCAIPLPRLPDWRSVRRWIRHETWLARTHQPGVTTEALLRKRPILVRRVMEAAGQRAMTPPQQE